MNKLNLKKRTLILLSNVIILLLGIRIFYALVITGSDLRAHYGYAMQLLDLKTIPFNDFLIYVENPRILSYPMWHISVLCVRHILVCCQPIIEKTGALYGQSVCAVTTTGYLLLTYNISRKVMEKKLVKQNISISILLGISLIFVGPWYIKAINERYYLGQGITTPWHNPTTIAVQPFAIFCFFLFWKIYEEHFQRKNNKENINFFLFSVILAISAFFKASLYQMFLPGLVAFCLIDFMKKRGKQFGFYVKIAFSIIPVCLVSLAQMSATFTGEASGGIGWGLFATVNQYTPHPLLSTLVTLIFPIYVTIIVVIKKYKDKTILFGWCIFLSAWIQYMTLYLKFSIETGDFAWGYYLSVELIYICALICFCNMYNAKKLIKLQYIGWLLYSIHVAYGFAYYLNMLKPNYNYLGGLNFNIL